jgi:hypothetical protein
MNAALNAFSSHFFLGVEGTSTCAFSSRVNQRKTGIARFTAKVSESYKQEHQQHMSGREAPPTMRAWPWSIRSTCLSARVLCTVCPSVRIRAHSVHTVYSCTRSIECSPRLVRPTKSSRPSLGCSASLSVLLRPHGRAVMDESSLSARPSVPRALHCGQSALSARGIRSQSAHLSVWSASPRLLMTCRPGF